MASLSAIYPENMSDADLSKRKITTTSRTSKELFCNRESHMLLDFMPNFAEAAVGPLVGIGAGAPELQEVAASNIGAIFMDTDNDSHGFMVRLPFNIDTAEDIRFAVYFNQSEVAAVGAVLWTLSYTELIANTTTISAGATVLDTIIPSRADLGIDVLTITEFGVMDGGTLNGTRGIDCIAFNMVYTEDTITDAEFLGVAWEYGVLFK